MEQFLSFLYLVLLLAGDVLLGVLLVRSFRSDPSRRMEEMEDWLDRRLAEQAEEEPKIAARNIQVTTTTKPRPPRIHPTRTWAKSTRRLDTPPLFINSPVSINSGMAIKVKLSTPTNIFCRISSGCRAPMFRIQIAIALTPKEMNTGTPMASITIKTARNTSKEFTAVHLPAFGLGYAKY